MAPDIVEENAPQPVLALLRDCLLERRTGKLTVEVGGAERYFFFVSGDLYLAHDHPLARTQGAPVGGVTASEEWVEKVLDYFDALGEVNHDFEEGTAEISTELLGPISTASLTMKGAVRGRDEFQLLRSLGGEEAELVAYMDAPLAAEVSLDPQEAFLLSRLEQPVAVKDLLHLPGVDSMEVARRLCRLASIELIGPHRKHESHATASLISRKLLERFKSRIAVELEREPLGLDPETHRQKLAGLMARLGGLNYYELLGVGVGSSAEEIHDRYTRLARLVHPQHATPLGLEGREAGIDLLFERATEAYLTLSDQDRRGRYLEKVGGVAGGAIFGHTEEARKEEVEELAGRNYKMAQGLVQRQDYYYAIELLNQALRMEARPEYYALLGHCQSQNPKWYDKAIASYGRAVQLDPGDADLRASLAEVYEKSGHKGRARTEYRAALQALPGHPEATAGLERLRAEREEDRQEEETPWWKKLLGGSAR